MNTSGDGKPGLAEELRRRRTALGWTLELRRRRTALGWTLEQVSK